MVAGTIGTKVFEDEGEWCFWHLDLEKVVAERDLYSRGQMSKEKISKRSIGTMNIPCYHWHPTRRGTTAALHSLPRI